MPTEAGKAAARAEVRQKMAGRTIEQVADLAKVDPQTFGDFLAGRRWPRLKTLNKIEDALELTRGTLAAIGEEGDAVQMVGGTLATSWEIEASPLADATEDALLTELGYRVRALQRESDELRKRVAQLEREVEARGEANSGPKTIPELFGEDVDAEDDGSEVFPPGAVPSWARDMAAHRTKRPKGTTFGNQDPGE